MSQFNSSDVFRSLSLPAHPGGAVGRVTRVLRHSWQRLTATGKTPSKLVVACSGGADSLALAIALGEWAPRQGIEIHAVCVDHGWRPESATEATAVVNALREYKYRYASVLGATVNDATGPDLVLEGGGHNAEASARKLRYRLLTSYAKNIGSLGVDTTIVFGHTLDDQAETVLLGLGRGSGAGSLQGMAEFSFTLPDDSGLRAPQFWRPLLAITRQDTLGFCQELRLPYVDDPSNYPDRDYLAADGLPLRRAALRHRALPALIAALGVDIRPALARTAQHLQADHAALQQLAGELFQRSLASKEDFELLAKSAPFPFPTTNSVALELSQLRTSPSALRGRVWRLALQQTGLPLGDLKSAHFQMIDRLVQERRSRGPLPLPGLTAAWRITIKSMKNRKRDFLVFTTSEHAENSS